jgi:transcriptional regulator of acetoin/glycerol metabolism
MWEHQHQEKWLDRRSPATIPLQSLWHLYDHGRCPRERATKEALVEKLHLERVSQRGIARVTGMSRSTIIKRLKKSSSARLAKR